MDDQDKFALLAGAVSCLDERRHRARLVIHHKKEDGGVLLGFPLELDQLGPPVCHLWIVEGDAQLLEHRDRHVLTPCGRVARPAEEHLVLGHVLCNNLAI